MRMLGLVAISSMYVLTKIAICFSIYFAYMNATTSPALNSYNRIERRYIGGIGLLRKRDKKTSTIVKNEGEILVGMLRDNKDVE
jgi:hypothetical protein